MLRKYLQIALYTVRRGYRSIRLLVTTVAVVQPHAGVELSGGQGQVYAHRQQYAVSAQ